MANFQLEDLLKDDKKDANLIPDLSKATCNSQEEFRRLMECVPEFKIKPEKLRKEDVKLYDKNFTFKTTKKELRALAKEFPYGDPVPPDMRSLNLQELQQVPIDWRMLTSIRPKLRQDEEMFSRLVEMGKLQLKSRARERREASMGRSMIRRTKNRAGIIETTVRICGECGEEYCRGDACVETSYDAFARVQVVPGSSGAQAKAAPNPDAANIIAGMGAPKGKKKKKKRGPRPPRVALATASNKPCSRCNKGARVLARKGKNTGTNGRNSVTRRESERSEPKEESTVKRKFRRKRVKKTGKKTAAAASP